MCWKKGVTFFSNEGHFSLLFITYSHLIKRAWSLCLSHTTWATEMYSLNSLHSLAAFIELQSLDILCCISHWLELPVALQLFSPAPINKSEIRTSWDELGGNLHQNNSVQLTNQNQIAATKAGKLQIKRHDVNGVLSLSCTSHFGGKGRMGCWWWRGLMLLVAVSLIQSDYSYSSFCLN